MSDYNQIFQFVDSTSRIQDELKSKFERMGTGGLVGQGDLNSMRDKLIGHFDKHNPTPLIVETDLEGNILTYNEAFQRTCKYERQELIGENIKLLKSSNNEEGIFTDLWNHITAGKTWSGRLYNLTKDYEQFVIEILIIPVLDPMGEPERYWSIAYDITEQAKQEEGLLGKNREVEESLQYAKRIQKTILPDEKIMDELLGEYFVMYKPKDIVSGDFYWFTRNIRTAFIAVVDCTGHGVPGAFMSLIGYNLLNQIVNEQKIIKPGEILAELHRQVRHTLKQDAAESKSRDGMDVCMVAIDLFDDSFEYAGANRPLYYYHKGELLEIKPDKFSIGGEQMEEERKYKNNIFEVEDGDAIYLVSDGFADQFGGPEDKKFSTKRLKQLIIDHINEPMSKQRAKFNKEWKEWKDYKAVTKEEEKANQIDDVTMVGVKLPLEVKAKFAPV